jgi:replicative DNA helicase
MLQMPGWPRQAQQPEPDPASALRVLIAAVIIAGCKLAGNLMRICGVLHVFAHALDADGTILPEVPLDLLRKVLALREFFIAHAEAAYGEMGESVLLEQRRAILAWIEERALHTFSKAELWRTMHSRHTLFRQAADLDEPLDLLCEDYYIRQQGGDDPRQHRRGRPPRARYLVNPKVLAGASSAYG